MPSLPDHVPTPSRSTDDSELGELVKLFCSLRGCKPKNFPDWMDKRDWIGALHGLLDGENESRERVSKQDLVALYTVCYDSAPADGVTIGELRVAVADALHFNHDYNEGGDGLRKETLKYGVMALAANHLSEEVSVTAANLTEPQQKAEVSNEYTETSDDPWGKHYSRDTLVQYLRDLAESEGEPVTTTTIKRADGPSVATISSRFGGIPEAREAAGLEVEPTAGAPRTYSDGDMIAYLRDLCLRIGHPPTERDVRDDTGISLSTITGRFGSLEAARDAARVGQPTEEDSNPEQEGRDIVYTREALIEHIQRLTEILGHPPTSQEISDMEGPSIGPVAREFGGLQDAREAAGVGHPRNSPSAETTTESDPGGASDSSPENEGEPSPDAEKSIKNKEYNRQELISHLQELAESIEGPPSTEDIKEAAGPPLSQFHKHFGGIVQAREEAGVGQLETRQRLIARSKGDNERTWPC